MTTLDEMVDAACKHFYPMHEDASPLRQEVRRSDMRGTIIAALNALNRSDFGDMPNFGAGLWSRRNLDAMLEDLNVNN